jgi:hypothetical protein
MNIHASSSQAEKARREGGIICKKLLPTLRESGVAAGHFVAIDVESGKYVTAATRLALMSAYKEQFGHTLGWVRRIDYGEHE